MYSRSQSFVFSPYRSAETVSGQSFHLPTNPFLTPFRLFLACAFVMYVPSNCHSATGFAKVLGEGHSPLTVHSAECDAVAVAAGVTGRAACEGDVNRGRVALFFACVDVKLIGGEAEVF